MNNKLLLSFAVSLLFVVQAFAADDIYIDLSVLDEVPQDSIGFVQSSPAFPIVKKTIKQLQSPKISAKKVQTSAALKNKNKNVVDVQPSKPQVLSVKEDVSVADDKVSEDILVAPKYNTEPLVTNDNVVSSETVEDKKELSKEVEDKNHETEITDHEVMSEKEASEVQGSSENGKELLSAGENKMSAQISEAPETDKLLAVTPREVYSVAFETDSSALSENNIHYLDSVIEKFDPSKKKKISIKAYNYDNGDDSFRKKRISLLRATEIRSYFLNRGFKNFSIKIINTTADSEDRNSVEIEEIN